MTAKNVVPIGPARDGLRTKNGAVANDRTADKIMHRAEEVKFCASNLKTLDDNGVFEGYASVFNRQDLGRDVVMPGAFRDSLKERGAAGVRMLFQHEPNTPLGVWEKIYEDARGLFVRGRLMLDVAKAREVHALMKAGALDGLSIGFRAEQGKRSKRTGVRQLRKVDLWEISIVTFPMMPEARVSRVKGVYRKRAVPTAREFERWLTQDAGFTRSEARAVVRDGLKGLDPLRDASESSTLRRLLIAQIAEAARLMRTGPGGVRH